MRRKPRAMGQSFELLPVEERAQQYREMADATFLKAQKVEDAALRAQYLSMATNWHSLAQALEAGISDPELIPNAPATSGEDALPGKAT